MKLILLLMIFFLPSFVYGQILESEGNFVQSLGSSQIDWTNGRIISTGTAFYDTRENASHGVRIAEREARIRATGNLHQTLGDISLDSSRSISQAVNQNTALKQSFAAMSKQAVVIHKTHVPGVTGMVEVYVLLDLWDRQVRSFMPGFIFVPPETVSPDGEAYLLPGQCIINIDAAQADLGPALIPAVVDEQDNILFRASVIGSGRNDKSSMISYSRAAPLDSTLRSVHGPGQTLWLRSVEASGRYRTDPVLHGDGAERFRRVISSTQDGCIINILMQ